MCACAQSPSSRSSVHQPQRATSRLGGYGRWHVCLAHVGCMCAFTAPHLFYSPCPSASTVRRACRAALVSRRVVPVKVSRTRKHMMLSSPPHSAAEHEPLPLAVRMPSEDKFRRVFHVFALSVHAKQVHAVRTLAAKMVLRVPKIVSVRDDSTLLPSEESGEQSPRKLILTRFLADPSSTHGSEQNGSVSLSIAGQKRLLEELNDGKQEDAFACPKTPSLPAPLVNLPEFIGNMTDQDDSGSNYCEGRLRQELAALSASSPLPESLVIKVVQVVVGFEHWSADTILAALMGANVTVPTSFEQVGHLIHLNLLDEQLPYKYLIGDVLLKKLAPRVRTVMNKAASTSGQFRTFDMELLAGEDNTVCEVRENNCIFEFDFRRVYWNSRLEAEHGRIVSLMGESSVLADAFAGVGPFVIPVAQKLAGQASSSKKVKKKGDDSAAAQIDPSMQASTLFKVYGNDLNPESSRYMQLNAKRNKVQEHVRVSNLCARDFLRGLVSDRVPFTHVTMNFPAGAPEFLDVFRGLYAVDQNALPAQRLPLPTVHCYCFAREDMWDIQPLARVARVLYGKSILSDPLLSGDDDDLILDETGFRTGANVRQVRSVAPNKLHVCVTFKLPEKVAYADGFSENNPANFN